MATGMVVSSSIPVPERETMSLEEAKAGRRDVIERIVRNESLPYFRDQRLISKRLYDEKRRYDRIIEHHED